MSASESEYAQELFLARGGVLATALMAKKKSGEIDKEYVYREYPKAVRIPRGTETRTFSTETIKGTTVEWTKEVEVFDEYTVYSEEEEERVLAGGKTSAQVEAERQELLLRAKQLGIKADPAWSVIRLKREMGETLNSPVVDEKAALLARVAELEEVAALKARIAQLEAANAGSAQADLTAAMDHLADAPRRGRPPKVRTETPEADAA